MVRIFRDATGSGEYVLQTTCLDCDAYIAELAEALAAFAAAGPTDEYAMLGILKNAMPIAFKLSNYKAETVMEQRTLVCGTVSPANCEVVASAGR